MARTKLDGFPPGYSAPPPGYPAAPASGFPTAPASGFPAAPLTDDPAAPPAGDSAIPPSGFRAATPPGYPSGGWQGPPPGYTPQQRPGPRWEGSGGGSSLGDDVADVVLNAATKFIGRAISRRVKRAYNERVQPTLAARQEARLRDQIAIAERHPDLRACLTDQVIFLAGGSRVLPMASVAGGLTVEQSDGVVAQLRNG
jgi:hypothetical protein